jgi:hypothetical protein
VLPKTGPMPMAALGRFLQKVTSGTHVCTKMAGCKSGYPVEFCSFNGDHTPWPDSGSRVEQLGTSRSLDLLEPVLRALASGIATNHEGSERRLPATLVLARGDPPTANAVDVCKVARSAKPPASGGSLTRTCWEDEHEASRRMI